jgi:hypothetical protein
MKKETVYAIFLVIVAVLFVVDIIGKTSRKQSYSPSSASVGREAKLYVQGNKHIIVARDDEALGAITQTAVSNPMGFSQLVSTDKAFTVDNDTKVLILNRGSAHVEVHILEGSKKGLSGWVPYEYVK